METCRKQSPEERTCQSAQAKKHDAASLHTKQHRFKVVSTTTVKIVAQANVISGKRRQRGAPKMPSGWRIQMPTAVLMPSLSDSVLRMLCRIGLGSRDGCELCIVALGLLLNSLQVERETPQQTRVNREADQIRNADNQGLSSSERTSRHQVCPIVVDVLAP